MEREVIKSYKCFKRKVSLLDGVLLRYDVMLFVGRIDVIRLV